MARRRPWRNVPHLPVLLLFGIAAATLVVLSHIQNAPADAIAAQLSRPGHPTLNDLGNTITRLDHNASIAGHVAIAMGVDDLPLVVYGRYYPWSDLATLKCQDPACTTTIRSRWDLGHMPEYPVLDIGADGLPIAAYMNADEPYYIRFMRCGTPECSSKNTFSTLDHDYPKVPSEISITIGTDGLPIIAYMQNEFITWSLSNYWIKVIKCADPACTSYSVSIVDQILNSASYLASPSITMGADGLPIIAYDEVIDQSHGSLKVAHCGNLACNADNTITYVDRGKKNVYPGGDSSIAIGGDELPVIAYYEMPSHVLKIAHCGNALCTANSRITTMNVTRFMYGPLMIERDGLPVIAFGAPNPYDYNISLTILKCGDVFCGKGNRFTVVDPDGYVAYYGDGAAIDRRGLPAVAYVDRYSVVLKLLRCGSPSCSVV